VSFFGDGGRSASPFFPFFFGDFDLLPGLPALLSSFFPLSAFVFSCFKENFWQLLKD
jgi:hypothetical protein